MYETYFNLTDRPFASIPRIDHYYPSAVIEAARNTLVRCIDRGEGVAMLIGPAGTGKSLLCQLLTAQFQKTFQVALLASTHLDTRRSLLQSILYELHRSYRGMDEGELRLSLVDYITLSDDCGRGVVLLVDEAQHLPLRLMDEIRSLTNVLRDVQPAVRLVLAGSHVLEERFASPKLESFSQRIAARCYLESFQRIETQAYIQGRVSTCGGKGEQLFPAETCQMVHKATEGVPRLINQVCDHVSLMAYAAGIRRIEPAHVEEAWADLQQLPTPWNAPATTPATGDGVIEFGGLDDGPAELSPIAGTIAAVNETDPVQGAGMRPAAIAELTQAAMLDEDPATLEQLRHIQKLLADVQSEFQPAVAGEPEVELVFDSPHPFEESFEEEEVINDRYAAMALPVTISPAVVAMAPAAATATMVEKAEEVEPARFGEAHEESTETELPKERSLRPIRSVVPPPRQEFGRLFAKLRRGL